MKNTRIWYTAALACLLAVPAAAQEFRALEFRDLQDHWARETVMELARAGVITGDPNGTFRPDIPVTRGEVAAMFLRAAGMGTEGAAPGVPPAPGTGDAAVGAGVEVPLTYEALQERARQMGVLEPGMAPGQQATRAEVAGMAIRVLQAAGVQTFVPEAGAAFADVPAAHRASGDILAAQERGLMQGYPDGTFRPQQPITRAEAAVVAMRLREIVAAGPGPVGVQPEPVVPPPAVPEEPAPLPAEPVPAPAEPLPPAEPAAPPVDPIVPRLEPEPIDPDLALQRAVAPGRRFVSGNFMGQSGNLVTPSALTLPRGVMNAGYHYLDKRIFGRGDSMNIFSASFGFTDRLEAGFATVDRRGTRVLANGKFLLIPETRSVPAVSVGVVDLFDSLGNDPAAYVVVGKNLTTVSPDVAEETGGRTLRAYVGFGTGPYDGVLGGLNFTMTPQLALMAEYAPKGPLTGRRDAVNLGARFGVTDRIQLQAGLFDFDNVGLGVTFRTGLPWGF